MKLRNYCLVVLGDTKDVFPEIVSVAENEPNMLDAKDVVIATFSSFAEPPELTDFFKDKARNFLLFDLNSQYSGYNVIKEDINEGLFGFLKESTPENMREKTKNLIKELTSSTIANNTTKRVVPTEIKNKIQVEDIDAMSIEEKQELFDKLIEKGADKLSPYDKKLMKKLAMNLGLKP